MPLGELILVAGALLVAGLAASLLAVRLRVPSLVLFLGVGMLIGSDGLGWIDLADYELARTIGVIALALILFEGGLTGGLVEIRSVLAPAISLATVGTVVTALVTGLAAAALLDLELLEGMLLGAVLSSTDGAAIFALLRTSTLDRRLARTLEGESGFNDPVAVLLVLGCIELLEAPGYGVADLLVLLVRQLGLGLAVGAVVGWLAVHAFRRAQLTSVGLYPVASLATAAVAFGAADALEGSGFLAVYLVGLALGTASIPAKQTVANFHQGLSWVAQVAMFLTLGLLVFPAQLDAVAGVGTALALVVVLLARPLAAVLATLPFGFGARERVLLGWAGMRGAVPVVLATFPVLAGIPDSVEFFNVVFFAVLLSTLLQGATFEPLARRLGLTTSTPALPRPLTEAGTIRGLGAEILEYPVTDEDAIAGARVRDLGLPRDAVVNVIVRGDTAIPPRGATRLRAGDVLHVLIRTEAAADVHRLLDRWRTGPIGAPARSRPSAVGRPPVFSAWRWTEAEGDPGRPSAVRGVPVAVHLRIRRDAPGTLVALEDGRYAVTGTVAAVGGRADVASWCRRRLARADDDERGWLQTVVGALAADVE
ncbi:MAG: potassium/proton antiporter [Actinomycetota bacterium]|nr:potassium/proton antiporter [Actinomycetota bacterium]